MVSYAMIALTTVYGVSNDSDIEQVQLKNQTSGPGLRTIPDSCLSVILNMDAVVLGALCVTGIIFVIVMSAFERRSSFKNHWCNGRFGPVVPLNLLDGYENRFAYSLAFGVTTTYSLYGILGNSQTIFGQRMASIINSSPSYFSVFFKIIATVVIATGAYPLFVSIGCKYKRFGAVSGLAYTIMWLSLLCYKTTRVVRACNEENKIRILSQCSQDAPQYGCLILLLLHFLRTAVLSFKQSYYMGVNEQSTWNKRHSHIFDHVRNLLRKQERFYTHEVNEQNGCINTFIAKLRNSVYKSRPEFKYSSRIISIFAVCFFTNYMITISSIRIGAFLWGQLANLMHKFGAPNSAEMISSLSVCYFIAVSVATIKSMLVLLNMLTWYRNHMTRLRQGNRRWLPASLRKFKSSASFLMAESMKFAGYQVAYVIGGYVTFACVLWITLALIASFIVYPIAASKSSPILDFLYGYWPALLMSLCTYLVQLLTAKYCFLAKRGKFFVIDNRKAFNIVAYYLFFFNFFLGIFSCLLRVLKSLVIGILFLERVQKSILPRSFEIIDPGYYAYLGYILIEHVHGNPVLKVFTHLLNESIKENPIPYTDSGSTQSLLVNSNEARMEYTRTDLARRIAKYKIIRNRWYVVYTLTKNPDLAIFRSKSKSRSFCVEIDV